MVEVVEIDDVPGERVVVEVVEFPPTLGIVVEVVVTGTVVVDEVVGITELGGSTLDLTTVVVVEVGTTVTAGTKIGGGVGVGR